MSAGVVNMCCCEIRCMQQHHPVRASLPKHCFVTPKAARLAVSGSSRKPVSVGRWCWQASSMKHYYCLACGLNDTSRLISSSAVARGALQTPTTRKPPSLPPPPSLRFASLLS